MKPVLFTLGPFNVYSFGIFLVISFIVSTFIIWKYGREDLKEEEYIDAFLMTSIIALISARVGYILFHPDDFGLNILKYVLVREAPGLSFFSGFFGGSLYLWWLALREKFSLSHLADIFSIASCIFISLAKIGEMLGGAGYGRETGFILGIKIIGLPGRHHPVELYEAFSYFLVFIILLIVYNKTKREKWPNGSVFNLFIFSLSIIIFLLEFLKSETLYLYGFKLMSLSQIIALIMFVVIIKPLFERIKIIKNLLLDKKT